jgi:hypothetical protein
MEGVRFLPRPVQVAGAEWLALEEACRQLGPGPVLVIVDTQARATVGVDESSNERMSAVFARIERLALESGACVLLVHHTGHAGEHGRGASAVLGAVQTELLIRKEGAGPDRVITVRIDKAKDDDDTAEIRLLPRVVPIDGMTRRSGEPETSVVLVDGREAVFTLPGLDPDVSAAVAALDKHGAPLDLGRDRMRSWLTARQISVGNRRPIRARRLWAMNCRSNPEKNSESDRRYVRCHRKIRPSDDLGHLRAPRSVCPGQTCPQAADGWPFYPSGAPRTIKLENRCLPRSDLSRTGFRSSLSHPRKSVRAPL